MFSLYLIYTVAIDANGDCCLWLIHPCLLSYKWSTMIIIRNMPHWDTNCSSCTVGTFTYSTSFFWTLCIRTLAYPDRGLPQKRQNLMFHSFPCLHVCACTSATSLRRLPRVETWACCSNSSLQSLNSNAWLIIFGSNSKQVPVRRSITCDLMQAHS